MLTYYDKYYNKYYIKYYNKYLLKYCDKYKKKYNIDLLQYLHMIKNNINMTGGKGIPGNGLDDPDLGNLFNNETEQEPAENSKLSKERANSDAKSTADKEANTDIKEFMADIKEFMPKMLKQMMEQTKKIGNLSEYMVDLSEKMESIQTNTNDP